MGAMHRHLKSLAIAMVVVLLVMQAPPFAGLAAGLVFSLLWGSPFDKSVLSKYSAPLLKLAVVGLGFGLHIDSLLTTGRESIWITLWILGIMAVVGFAMAYVLGINMKTALLITSGTAICGGSAIAAMSPIVKAKNHEISVALGVVFILNAVALLLFPLLGRWLGLNDAQFAWWAAMAIHDTSSVVGAASQYGDQSLALATSVKLTRALWIIPVSLVAALILQPDKKKFSIPFFIFYFVIAAIIGTYVPWVQSIAPFITQGSKSLFTVVLFLIGLSLDKSIFKQMGTKPIIYGITLWIVTAVSSLVIICGCCYYSRF